ncbi:MAG: HD domain-containing protein [Spirochaetales bacterium]|nr:HD domain-containing protein [Spirochaetales bacterium]
MSFENLENIVSLLCTIAGLLYCVFKYIDRPERGYRHLIAFFLANFLSEYYWTIYQLVMGSYPDVSEFVAYMGWNVGYLFLFLAVLSMRSEGSGRYFHPVMILPVLTNVPQFFLYISYGGVLNNLWEMGITTLTSIVCIQQLMYHVRERKGSRDFPWLSLFVLSYLVFTYGMWLSSCFNWKSEILNPYLYCSLLTSVLRVFIVFGAGRHYSSEEDPDESKSTSELRFQVLIQSIVSLVIIGICAAGFLSAFVVRNSLSDSNGLFRNERQMVVYLYSISVVLILLIILILYLVTRRYRKMVVEGRKMAEGKRSRLNLFFTIGVTLVLMVFAVIYNSIIIYRASVVSVYEEGEEEIKSTATELENYLSVAVTTLRVAADSVDLLEKSGSSIQAISDFIVNQTEIQSKQFDENFTGLYAYVNGQYIDGLEWVPPEGYDPTSRTWYRAAVEAEGNVVIVPPYVDAQTGSVVISIVKAISGGNVVCLDVIVNHLQDVIRGVEIAGKGYGMVVNDDGFIVAHRDESLNGENIANLYGRELLSSITDAKGDRVNARIDGQDCTLFVAPVMDQWHTVIVIDDTELFDSTYSQLAMNFMVSFVTFCLISFFYYLGYRNEQIYGRKVEQMNIQVASALAAAIDAKDRYTNGHSARVARYARMIAERSGYSKDKQDEIYMMALLHDVGKIGIPDNVINKTAKLTDEEYALVQRHPVIGEGILSSIKERPDLVKGARWHHERYDGTGYPDGLSGETIPEEARLIAVADAYDAMTSKRSYRDVLPQKKVLSELRKGSGTQFDPHFAEVMIELIKEDRGYKMRER